MIQKVKLTGVFINTTGKNGAPLVNKNGEAFAMAVIKYGNNEQASMYLGKNSKAQGAIISQWKQGDEVAVIIEQDGQYTNFKIAGKIDLLEVRVEKLEKILAASGATAQHNEPEEIPFVDPHTPSNLPWEQ